MKHVQRMDAGLTSVRNGFSSRFWIALCVVLPVTFSSAADRICSVYLESYNALQKQALLSAEVFKSPQAGTLPMMLTATQPWVAQIQPDQPVSLHLFEVGADKPCAVAELTAAGTGEALLQAIIGATATLPQPVGGIYTLGKFSARIIGRKVQFSEKADDFKTCLTADGALPPMPALPGTIRVVALPARLKPMIAKARKSISVTMNAQQKMGGNTEQAQQVINGLFDFYSEILGQVEVFQMGLVVQKEGLFIRTCLDPVKGSDLGALIASMTPVKRSQLSFLQQDSILGLASGTCVLPENLRKRIMGLYTTIYQSVPGIDAAQAQAFTSQMNSSMAILCAAKGFTGKQVGPTIQIQGACEMKQADAYLKEQLAMIRQPVYQEMIKKSGFQTLMPVVRSYKGVPVHTFNMAIDEAALKAHIRMQMPTNLPPEGIDAAIQSGMVPVRAMLELFGSGYEYAAKGNTLAFGMGSPEMINCVLDRMGVSVQPAVEADRITQVLSVPTAPLVMGRFSLPGFVQIAKTMIVPKSDQPKAPVAVGEGCLFAEWLGRGQMLSITLISASDVLALKPQVQASVQTSVKVSPQGK